MAYTLDDLDLLYPGADDRRIRNESDIVAEAGAAGDCAECKQDVAADDVVEPQKRRGAGGERSPRCAGGDGALLALVAKPYGIQKPPRRLDA